VSSYACVYLSDGRPVCWFRNGVDQLFFILFTRDDWIELAGSEAWLLVKENYGGLDEDEAHVTGFQTTVGTLRDRLDVLGVPVSAVASEVRRLAIDRAQLLEGLSGRLTDDEFLRQRQDEVSYLKGLTWESWLRDVKEGVEAGLPITRVGSRSEVGSPSYLASLWEDHDVRYQLRAILEALPRDEVITLDLDDLLEGGWLDPSVDPRDHANALVAYASQGGLPPIVITEGRFDVEVLSAALRLRRPHLVGYLRFPDFSYKNEGGAAALRQTLRAFAVAGVPNRVVALFDNDTAAQDVLHSFPTNELPPNLVVTHLPALGMAKHYPTVGPQGENAMDVNGLAASIEMFLGADVLTQDDGSLQPVIWGGFVKRLGAYQGEVSEKEAVHERFRQKVAEATASADAMAQQDWEGLDLVLDHVLAIIRDTTLDEDE
jgi:hypothetical protein